MNIYRHYTYIYIVIVNYYKIGLICIQGRVFIDLLKKYFFAHRFIEEINRYLCFFGGISTSTIDFDRFL